MLRLLSLACYAGLSETELGHPTLAFGVMGETGQIKLLSHYFWPQLSLIFGSLAPSKQFFLSKHESTYRDFKFSE